MNHLFVLGHAEVPSRVSSGGYITKRESIPVYGDDPRHYAPLVALALNAEMVEWLIDQLDSGRVGREDGFVTDLRELRDEMKKTLWEREAA